jgi:hypothetical protein
MKAIFSFHNMDRVTKSKSIIAFNVIFWHPTTHMTVTT